jgi:ABC-type nickel/cobalt efflux system permease component RcnA
MSPRRRAVILGLCLAAVALAAGGEALAQARNPFNVGVTEGGGQATGLVGWIIAKQIEMERQLSATVRAVHNGGGALWTLAGLSFVYGVFHAAGPGHGKAVVASYMLANERALRRGLVISFLAALLQGVVAIAIVGVLAFLLRATAARMRDAASFVEMASFAGVAVLGAWLVWRKGNAFVAAWKAPPASLSAAAVMGGGSRFLCEAVDADAAHVHDENCGHFHMPDPSTLGGNFSWREAALTVVAAGSRPCSGAIIVLVFALAQGLFWAGVASTFAMALGTAITTGALAATAVFAKSLALRFVGVKSRRGDLLGRGIELLAAFAVLFLGVALCLGYAAAGI